MRMSTTWRSKERLVNFKRELEEIETRKSRRATIRCRVNWKNKKIKIGDKSVRQKNSKYLSISLEITREWGSQKIRYRKNMNYFYQDLYKHRDISEATLEEIFDGFPITIASATNITLTQDITKRELYGTIVAMAT